MSDLIYEGFLKRQQEEGLALAAQSDLLDLLPLPGPLPSHYIAVFRCRGLALTPEGAVVERDRWDIGISFPPDYLRAPVHVSRVLTYLGPEERPHHANIRPPFLCVTVFTGMSLVLLLHAVFDLLTWNNHAFHDALNLDAAQWARQQPPGRFPVDRRPLKWRAPIPIDQPLIGR